MFDSTAEQLTQSQQRVLDSTAPIVVMHGEAAAGKTFMQPRWMLRKIKELGAGDYLVASSRKEVLAHVVVPEFWRYFEPLPGAHLQKLPYPHIRFTKTSEEYIWGAQQDLPTTISFVDISRALEFDAVAMCLSIGAGEFGLTGRNKELFFCSWMKSGLRPTLIETFRDETDVEFIELAARN